MKLEEFVNSFADQFEVTERDVISAQTEFKMLEEWDSMIGLSVIGMVFNTYKVKISGEDINNAVTIVDLFELVQSKSEIE
ncbi:MAG: acyl carrier protein [Clostridia bacterium]|jgi:acyl carrier protein|nr:acyl carrier protein [Clostridia bacterium]